MRAPNPLLDSRMLEKLERLTLCWQKSFNGLFGGHNPSGFPGPGQEFLDHRHFQQGDDLRGVNWLAYMRLERLFLKMFQIEPRVPVRIFLDTSESMACGAEGGQGGEAKFASACRLAGMLCYVGLVRLDTIVLQPFAGHLAQNFVAQGGRYRFAPALNFLTGLETGGRSNFYGMARQFISANPAGGLAVVISDFLDDSEAGCEKPLQYLADFGNELLLVHVGGLDDRFPPWRGPLELVDAESGETLARELDPGTAKAHQAAYEVFCQGLERLALRHGGRYLPLSTDVPVEEAIFGALALSGGIRVR